MGKTISHIIIDSTGTARIDGTRIKVKQIAEDNNAGLTANDIVDAYPHLSLAQVHAALAFYFDHKAEVDAEIKRDRKQIAALRKAAGPSLLARKLRQAGRKN